MCTSIKNVLEAGFGTRHSGMTQAWCASGWKQAVQHSASTGKQRGIKRYQNIPQWEAFQPKTAMFELVNTVCVKKKVSWGYNRALKPFPTNPSPSSKIVSLQMGILYFPPFCTLAPQEHATSDAHSPQRHSFNGKIQWSGSLLASTGKAHYILCSAFESSYPYLSLPQRTLQYSWVKFSLLLPT